MNTISRRLDIMRWAHEAWRDLTYALRSLRKSPAFAATAALSLALGIGATTTIFSVVHAVVIDPFPYRSPETLLSMSVRGADRRGTGSNYTVAEFVELGERTSVFEGLIASTISDISLTGVGSPERLRGNYVSMNTFEVMGVPPLLGRTVTGSDTRPDAPPVAVLGYRFWQRQFGGDTGIVGRTLRLNGVAREVIGVMPRRFMWRGADVYLPTRYDRGLTLPGVRTVHVMGRPRHGVTHAQIDAELRPVLDDFRQRAPERYPASYRIVLENFGDTFASSLGPTLLLLLGAVGLLLLIACGNVSNLQLARATAREREMALRATLGAGRWRLIRQLLTESAVLAVLGGTLGVALAQVSLWAVMAVIPPNTIPDESHVRLNTAVLLFSLGLACTSTLLFGLAPAWQLSRTDANGVLREGGRSLTAGGRQARLRSALIVVELALSMVLLVGAGLMVRTLARMQQVALPFDPSRILTMRVPLPETRYPAVEDRARFLTTLLERVEGIPGVRSAAVNSGLPFLGARGTRITLPGRSPIDQPALVHETTASYLRILRAGLIAGRTLERADVTAVRHVGVVNQAFARRYFGSASPIGQTVRLDYLSMPPVLATDNSFEVIGVVADIRNQGVQRETWPEIYVPFGVNGNFANLIVEAAVPPLQLDRSVRAQVYAIDAEQPVTDVRTLDAVIDEWIFSRPRFSLILLGAFSLVGLVLAVVGVYGIMAYAVARQQPEIGVRMALGATRADVLRLVVGRGVRLVAVGAVVGGVFALWATQFLSTQIWGISARDPWAFAGVTLVLASAGLLACLVPAIRAARISPLDALRSE